MKNKKLIKILLISIVVIVAGIIFSCTFKNKNAKALSEDIVETSGDEEESEDESLTKICVHVCGQVNAPGVYYLDSGARIHDAINLAGGFGADADIQYLNLAALVEDGQQIYIPSISEVASGKVAKTNYEDDGLIDINNASIDELKTLPGIGDIKAKSIISYRDEVGNFSNIDDIKNVAGIKDSSFEKIKDYIKV